MTIQIHDVPPFDPFLNTGPTRQIRGMARMGTVTPNTLYGTGGNVEYATRLYVGVTGDVTIVKWDGTTQLLKNLLQGVVHEICSIQVNSSGTTATNIVWGS
jgi:hypothetical protein